jgi:acetoin utilization deacetylase AcuC-like enzyme
MVGVALILAGPVGADRHDGGPRHPERQRRIDAVMRGVEDLHLGDELVHVDVAPASRAALERVHDAAYLDELEQRCRAGGGDLDEDTYATTDSYDTARLAAGAGLAVVDLLESRGSGVGFVAARPPGHHALAGRAMGFCLLNNVAVAAASLTAAGRRVAIIDWDVHHGNGTQELFWDDANVLFVSMHQSPLYPGTGDAREVGGPGAPGLTVNVPLPEGATGDVAADAIDRVAGPVVDAFAPDWVLVSCGFDAHRADPLGGLALSSGDFAALAQLVRSMAAPGRLALFLEGGYDLDALRSSVTSTIGALLGARAVDEGPTSGGPGRDAVTAAITARRRSLDTLS